MDMDKLTELAASIQLVGLISPICVRAPHDSELTDYPGKSFVLVAGGRRMAAHVILGREEIEAIAFETLDPITAEIMELDENIRRAELSWADEVTAKARIHALRHSQDYTQTADKTAAEIGVSAATLSRDLKLATMLKIDPTLKTMSSRQSAIRHSEFTENIKNRLADGVIQTRAASARKLLYTADALEWAKTLPDASVDLVFTDLPYGIDQFENQSTGENHAVHSKFDDSAATVLPFVKALVPEMARVVKSTGWIALFMSWEYHTWLMAQFEQTMLRPETPPWIWNRADGPGNWGHYPDRHAGNRYEILVIVPGGLDARFFKKPIANVLTFSALVSSEKTHNHHKPPELCAEIISRLSTPGGLVVDFCFGSGQHLATAAAMGRNILGCELNPLLLDAALVRVAEAAQTFVLESGNGS
jgi:site-specific DNA-methyltransferase (adenine-specific)